VTLYKGKGKLVSAIRCMSEIKNFTSPIRRYAYAYFSILTLTFAKIVRAFTKMGPIFAKVKIKIELKIVPLSGPPRSTFAKVDHFDFGKIRLLQKSNFDFGKSENFHL